MEVCSTCKFFRPVPTTPNDLSECRRHAPGVVPDSNLPTGRAIFPRVLRGWRCGDYEPMIENIDHATKAWA